MNRIAMVVLVMVAAVAMAAAQPALADQGRGEAREDGWQHGPGMTGPGMGFGPGMGGPMAELLAGLSPEKREQAQRLHLDLRRNMIDKRAELERLRVDMAEIMGAFPLDTEAAQAKFDRMAGVRREMFALRTAMMASMQQIVGKELWQEAHARMGMGFGKGYGPGGGTGHGRGGGGRQMGPPRR